MQPKSKQVQNLRKQLGLTQKQVAEMLDMSASHLAHCEQGVEFMSPLAWRYWLLLIESKRVHPCDKGHIGCAIALNGSCFEKDET